MAMMAALKQYVRSQAEKNLIVRKALVYYRERIYRSGQDGVVTKIPLGILNVELTNKCPMKCVMCARTNNMTRARGLMEFPVFKEVIDQYVAVNPERARTHDFWLHHFGESLQHPEFGKFIRYAVSKNVKAGLSVNPIMLTPPVASELLSSGLRTLIISLDGHDDESFAQIRGIPHAFEKSKQRLLAFLQMKKELGAATRIILSMINFGKNQLSIDKMRKFWATLEGIDEFRSKTFCSWNGDAADVNRFATMKSDNRQLRKVYSVVGCLNPWQHFTVAWDGDVLPCCYDYDKKYVLGNIKKESLVQIWNGGPMQTLRREFLSNNVSNPLCRDCPMLYPPLDHKDDV